MTRDERAIRELVDSWMKATSRGDLDKVLELIADDCLFLVPGREPFGKAEFKSNSQAMRGVKIDGQVQIEELQVTGDWAWLRNYIEIEVTPPGATSSRRSGYTLTILRRNADGNWRLVRDSNLVS